jgi:hypothetical protein
MIYVIFFIAGILFEKLFSPLIDIVTATLANKNAYNSSLLQNKIDYAEIDKSNYIKELGLEDDDLQRGKLQMGFHCEAQGEEIEGEENESE